MIVLPHVFSPAHGVGSNCPAAHPCGCKNQFINCKARKFDHVPPFSSTTPMKYHTLELNNNMIPHILPNAFVGLNTVNVSTILLDHNQISYINDSAFNGIQTNLLILNLANNKLKSLPEAIQILSSLRSLDVSSNPIPGYQDMGHHHGVDGLTDSVMRALGDTLIEFRFGSRTALTSWPKSLSHLNQLRELSVSGANIQYFPANAFYGFEHTLRNLTIEHASLAAVPLAINSLTTLEELHLDNLEQPFGDDAMIAAPFSRIAPTLKILSLKHDSLTVFPEVIQQLISLKSLVLDGNDLEFVSDEAIKLLKNANVTTLSLRNCNLKRVPGAISDLTVLLKLNLDENNIRSLESTDLHNLNHLETLSLSQNPLKYISDNALCGLNQLIIFNLKNTSLTEVSRSFQTLKKLRSLDLTASKIDCTCDITWMKKWKQQCQASPVEISGQCETINMGISTYIDTRLPNCPDYIAANFTCGLISCNS